jgi:hypothetical protein
MITKVEPRLLPDELQQCACERLGPIEIFIARAEARAVLFAAGELALHEAVDALQAATIASGLVEWARSRFSANELRRSRRERGA